MDSGHDSDAEVSTIADNKESSQKPRRLPLDLPTSLDDRRAPPALETGVEIYDAWQGQSQYLTSTVPAKHLSFGPLLDQRTEEEVFAVADYRSKEARLNRMRAAQTAHRYQAPSNPADDVKMATSTELSDEEKKEAMQSALNMAASNGDVHRLRAILSEPIRSLVDIDTPDDEGTPPLVYASCFGHAEVVVSLLDQGADINAKDKLNWTSLVWATANQHDDVVKILLQRGASHEAQSNTGRTAFDFVVPDSEISDYLNEKGYKLGTAGIADDFYKAGFSSDQVEEEMLEREMKRRMQMDSAINLEVDLGNLGFDEPADVCMEKVVLIQNPDDVDGHDEFVWDRCLKDQMFVFQEADLEHILSIAVTNMQPQRSPTQKPVPANVIFLCARYAHYYNHSDLLALLLNEAMAKIDDVIEVNQLDMTVLAFWMSNVTLLLHYLKKDSNLGRATGDFQLHLADIINELFVLVIRDAERRIDRVLDAAILQHETIQLDDVQFKDDWNLFKSKNKPKVVESLEKRFGPPTPQQRAKVSPRHVTSLLSSTLFVLDLYDVHSLIITQIIAQLYFWLGAELFNRIITNRKYLARSKAMQIRMNVSALEEWARNNNRQPEHYENGSSTAIGETVAEAAKHHLEPPIQLLQWLQILSTIGETSEALETTIKEMPRLSAQQLVHAVRYYRAEVGEPTLPKAGVKRLQALEKEVSSRRVKRRSLKPSDHHGMASNDSSVIEPGTGSAKVEDDDTPEGLMLDPALMLPFSLPTSTDMVVKYGAGFGGVDRERARKYTPTLPSDFLHKLDAGKRRNVNLYEGLDDDADDDETQQHDNTKQI